MNAKNLSNMGKKSISPTLEILINDKTSSVKIINRRLFTIGRTPDNNLSIDSPLISRYHAQIEKVGSSFFLVDLHSKHGTFVNSQRIMKRELQNLDKLTFGDENEFEIIFHLQTLKKKEVIFSNFTASKLTIPTPDMKTRFLPLPFTKESFSKLNMLLEASQASQLSLNLREILNRIVKSIINITNADQGHILLKDDRGDLAFKVSQYKLSKEDVSPNDISWGVVNKVIMSGISTVSGNVQADSELKKHESIAALKLESIMCIPLFRKHIIEDSSELTPSVIYNSKENIMGVIYVDSRAAHKIFTRNDLKILETLAGHASVVISNSRLFQKEKLKSRKLVASYIDTVRVLANAIEARDYYTRGHADRVSAISIIIAEEIGWSKEKIYELKIGAYLHDIGKLGVPDAILNKQGRLTEEEYDVMKEHPRLGAKIIQGISSLEIVTPYLLYHQERFDGTGYPFGLKGKEIPEEGRLLAVADVFDALTSTRPYRDAIPFPKAYQMILNERGKDFDPYFVDIFKECYEKKKITEEIHSLKSDSNLNLL